MRTTRVTDDRLGHWGGCRLSRLASIGALGVSISSGLCNAQPYILIDVGHLGGGSAAAWGINSQGKIVGQSRDTMGRDRPFVWDEQGGMIDLGTLGGSTGVAYDINDVGTIVGSVKSATSIDTACRWEGAGVVAIPGLPASWPSAAYGLNNAGRIAGSLYNSSGVERAYIYDPVLGVIDPFFGSAEASSARAVNTAGNVAGFRANGSSWQSFLWSPSTTTYFSALYAVALNDTPQVVGEHSSGAFRWRAATGVQAIPSGVDLVPGRAWAISPNGAIVGFGRNAAKQRRGFVYTDVAGLIDLNSLVDAGDLEVTEGRDVNSLGSIAAVAIDSAGVSHAVVLRPRPVQPVLFVRADAPQGGDGLSWATAYASLQDALTAASLSNGVVEQVWVAAGVYRPTRRTSPNEPRSATFQLVGDVELFGGFAGHETTIVQRDWNANPTVLTGDLAGNDGPNFANNAENCAHVVTATLPDLAAATLDGFIVTGGNAYGNNFPSNSGGGLLSGQGSAVIRNCAFRANNAAANGGGACATSSRVNFEHCSFEGNRSYSNGAGLYATFRAVAESCTFTGNFLLGGGGSGGAIYTEGFVLLGDCLIIGNSTGGPGGGVSLGGASLMLNCKVIANSSGSFGGGAAASSTSVVVNCLFNGNQAALGGAIANVGMAINCTFTQNFATQTAGGLYFGLPGSVIQNCVVWGNTHNGLPGEISQIGGSVAPSVSYSRVQNWTGILGGMGNSGANPRFIDIDGPDDIAGNADDNLRLLSPVSACIDAGDSTALPLDTTDIDNDGDTGERLPMDLDRNPRTRDDPVVPNVGIGSGSDVVDIGAYELQPLSCYANCDGSSVQPVLNVNDFLCFQNRYAQGDPYANCDGSTIPPTLNVNDFLCFLGAYAQGCP